MASVSAEVIQVLDQAAIVGNCLKLQGQIARPLYVATDKVLRLAGGRWDRKAAAHVFNYDAAEVIDQIVLTGEVTDTKREFGFFETPKAVADRVIELAQIKDMHRVLEPSAGHGALAVAAAVHSPAVACFEIQPDNVSAIQALGFAVRQVDFLTVVPDRQFDRVVMNPPFAKQADIKHVMHAAKFLRHGGRLVSVMASGALTRANKLATEFRAFVAARGGEFEDLPENSFKDAGTGVNTILVSFDA